MRPYWRVMLIVLLTILVVRVTDLFGPWLIRAIVGLITNAEAGQGDTPFWISFALATISVVRSLRAAVVFR